MSVSEHEATGGISSHLSRQLIFEIGYYANSVTAKKKKRKSTLTVSHLCTCVLALLRYYRTQFIRIYDYVSDLYGALHRKVQCTLKSGLTASVTLPNRRPEIYKEKTTRACYRSIDWSNIYRLIECYDGTPLMRHPYFHIHSCSHIAMTRLHLYICSGNRTIYVHIRKLVNFS